VSCDYATWKQLTRFITSDVFVRSKLVGYSCSE